MILPGASIHLRGLLRRTACARRAKRRSARAGVVQRRRLGREISVSTSGSVKDLETHLGVWKTLLDAWTSVLDTFGETLILYTWSNPVREIPGSSSVQAHRTRLPILLEGAVNSSRISCGGPAATFAMVFHSAAINMLKHEKMT